MSEADGGWHMYPQPILSGLYFDESDYMTLGFSDRTSIQGGNRNFSSETGTTAHYETGASGDILIASTTNSTLWTLESNGTVGNRTAATLNAAQGPGGFEFYNDRMNVGEGNTHQEVALGSLAGIRGTREVVSTAYDPLAGIRLAGNSWYSTTTGTNLAGYEHTADPGGSTTSTASGTFQKGGGLGAVQLLAEAAPIEVGNRVWFDADQDGIQDADEPSIAGATVELRQGATVISTTTTAADGSYYFSSDPDSAYFAGSAFVPNGGDYTITFVKPAGNVTLSGPNSTAFGTIPWSSATLTGTGGTALAGSDPDPSSGVVTFTAGPAGSVNHDIDAGYRADSSFTVAKALAGAGVPLAGQTFTMTATATDFRGAALPLGAAGTITLAAGATSSPVSVPTGSSVTVSESGTGAYKAVSITPSTATVVTGSTPVAFTVTNTLYEAGRFRVSKSVTGAAGGSVPSTQSYTVNYSHPGGSGTLTVTKGGTSAFSSPIPHGAVVTLSEVAPTGAAADVVYGTALWSGTGVTDNGDGTSSFTMTEGASLEVALTNPTTQLTGGFSVTKSVTGTGNVSVPAGYSFVVQYSLDGGTTWVDRTVSKNAPTFTVAGVPTGRSVLVREVAPTADIADVAWGTPVYSGAGVSVAAGVASLTIGDGTTVAVGLENPTTRLTGSFSITKTVGADATASVPGNTPFTLQYSVDGGTTWVTTTVTKDSPTFTSLPIPTGTTVLITEDAPGNIAGVSWGDPIFSGAGVTVTADGASLVIGNATTVAVSLLNPTTQLVQFSITKNVTGPAEATLTPGHLFTGTWTYPGKATPGTFSIANGGVFTSPGIPRGTVVTITETDPTGGLPVGSSWGIPSLAVGATAYDNGDPITMSALGVTAVDLLNPTIVTPDVSIVKGDALGNAADTIADGATYAAGTSRQIDIVVTNTGTDDLENITLTDETLGGDTVTDLSWTLPNGDIVPADLAGTTWTVVLPAGTVWAPGEVITGTATLTVALGSTQHTDRVTVEATGVNSGIDVSDDNDYNAFTGGIQVIEYNGELADPVVGTPGAWVIPTKPLVSEDQDANDTDHAVVYPVNTPQTVRWVVTNTGTTSLTNIDLLNPVGAGPDVLATWTADLSDFGGPTNYTFVPGAPWPGILPPGASFFATGTLTLPANAVHADLVTVAANIVVPGTAAVALDSAGTAVVVDDEDPFNAKSGIGPFVDIEKGDGTGSTITNDADTMLDAEDYQPGETRTVVFRVQNTGDEELRNVTLSDETLAGASVQSLVWTFPDSTTASAAPVLGNLTATWANTFSGTSTWAPGAWIYGTAQLTLTAAENPHVDDVTVTAIGVDSATTVTDHDLYNAVTGAVQVIKYDGDTADPVVKDANGDWIVPSKTAMNAGQDADTPANAVQVAPNAKRTIRWVITNTGTTTLTSIDVEDVTLSGPAIDAGWTADLSPIGGPVAYDFVANGPWEGEFAPGESFFSEGTYRLGAFQTHSDNVNVIATIVVPATDAAGRLAGGPMRDLAGNLVPLTNAVGVVHTVDGGDPFVARARLSLVITGVELQLALMSAFTLLLLGFGLVLLARRRRRAQG